MRNKLEFYNFLVYEIMFSDTKKSHDYATIEVLNQVYSITHPTKGGHSQ